MSNRRLVPMPARKASAPPASGNASAATLEGTFMPCVRMNLRSIFGDPLSRRSEDPINSLERSGAQSFGQVTA